MAVTGDLEIRLTDMAGGMVSGITLDLQPVSGEPGTGGEPRTVNVGTVQDLTVTGIPCRDGIGTVYKVIAFAPHFRPYGYFQLIKPRKNRASDDVEFWVKPGDVKKIGAPPFGDLPAQARSILSTASMIAVEKEDRDLLGLSGAPLYAALGPLRQACFLNLMAKANDDTTAAGCLAFFEGLFISRQDRFFAAVDSTLPKRLTNSPCFISAPSTLHLPPPGYVMTGESFKSRDAHANLQVTFMRHTTTNQLAADIDIDEASGVEHGLEVIRNAAFKKRTNPYLIHEFLLEADPIHRSLDPGYTFVF